MFSKNYGSSNKKRAEQKQISYSRNCFLTACGIGVCVFSNCTMMCGNVRCGACPGKQLEVADLERPADDIRGDLLR